MEHIMKYLKTATFEELKVVREDIDSAYFLPEEDRKTIKDYFKNLKYFDIKTSMQDITFFGECCNIDNNVLTIKNKLTGNVTLSTDGGVSFTERPYINGRL